MWGFFDLSFCTPLKRVLLIKINKWILVKWRKRIGEWNMHLANKLNFCDVFSLEVFHKICGVFSFCFLFHFYTSNMWVKFTCTENQTPLRSGRIFVERDPPSLRYYGAVKSSMCKGVGALMCFLWEEIQAKWENLTDFSSEILIFLFYNLKILTVL